MANEAIRRAAAKLKKSPGNGRLTLEIVHTVVDALARSPGRRSRRRAVSIPKRIAQLLRTYAPDLSPGVVQEVRTRSLIRAQELGLGSDTQPLARFVPLVVAAPFLGLSPAQLRLRLCDSGYRRSLGWPRPLGGEVLFAREMLDPWTAGEYLRGTPSTEPWPQSEWPAGWLA